MAGVPVRLDWEGPLADWPLVKHSVPGDGHCLLHAICAAFFKPYYTGRLADGKQVSPSLIVQTLRKQLARLLKSPVPNTDPPVTVYQTLGRGKYEEFSKEVPEYTLENMMATLNSNSYLGYGYLEFLSDALNKDIYLLSKNTRDVWIHDSPELHYKGRPSVVLLYDQDTHFEMVGLQYGDQTITYFQPDNLFVQVLRSRVFRSS